MPSLFSFFNMRPEAALLCAVLSAFFAVIYASEQRVVCYYTNWSVYRPGNAKFSPQNINPYLCTHLIYAFGGLTRENGLRPYDKYQDIEQGGYAKFTGLKTYNKALKTMLAIGGWNEGSTRFSPLVADTERREEFVKNVVRFLRQNHFDGLDLDWEYPAFRDGGKPRDRDNYAQLVQELREAFDRESSKTGRSRLLLTMAVPAGIEYVDKGYDIPKLNKYLDFMNILSYDYHSAFEPAVNHHSPLYPLEDIDEEYNFDAQLTIDYTIEHYLKSGADRDKLVLGIPTYGRSYTLFNPLATEVGAPADGPGEQGDATREKGYLAYYEICESLESNEWKVEKPNPKAMGPYAFKGNQWVGYDDEDIVRKKAKYVSEKGLGGIMFWAIDNDDFRGKCHGRPYPLIEAGKEALLGIESRSPNDISSTLEKGRSRSTSKPTTKPIISSTTTSSRKRRPKPKTSRPRGSSESSTVTTPVYVYPATTPEPPTTPDPGSDFKCKDEGFFPHPRDCKKYFWCLDSGPSNLGIVAHQFTCPSGLYFNKAADSCDYTRNVICNKKKGGDGSSSTTPRPKVTAATSKTTRLSSATSTTSAPSTTTTRTTTTTTLAPELEEEEEEDDEEEYDEADQEDPRAIKELIKLLQEIGGLEGLQRQLAFKEQNSANGDSVAPTSGISRSLYNRVLNRGNTKSPIFKTRQNAQVTSSSTSTTPSYKSSIRNRGGPQNQGLEALDEVSNLKKEKPQYVTIRRERPTTPLNKLNDESDEENSEEELDEIEEEEKENEPPPKNKLRNPEYLVLDRRSKSTSPSTQEEITKEITTPKYVTISRGTSSKREEDSETQTLERNEDSKFQIDKNEKENESLESNSKLIQITPSYTQINRSKAPITIDEVEEEKEVQTESITLSTIKVSPINRTYVEINRNRELNLITPVETSTLPYTTFQTSSYEGSTTNQLSTNKLDNVPSRIHTTTFSIIDTEAETTNLNKQTIISSTSNTPEETSDYVTATTQEPSTTISFTPTVTRVITSVTESGTERQRISVNRIKGHYILDLGPKLYGIVTTPIPGLQASSEKIMEINRVTHVTKDINSQSTPHIFSTEDVTASIDKIKEVNRISHTTFTDEDVTTPLNFDEDFDTKNEFYATENPSSTTTTTIRPLKQTNIHRNVPRTRRPNSETVVKEDDSEPNNNNSKRKYGFNQRTNRKPFNQTNSSLNSSEIKEVTRRKFNRFRTTTSKPVEESDNSLSTTRKYRRFRTTVSPNENEYKGDIETTRNIYRLRSTTSRSNEVNNIVDESTTINPNDNENNESLLTSEDSTNTGENDQYTTTTLRSNQTYLNSDDENISISLNDNENNKDLKNLSDSSTTRKNYLFTTTQRSNETNINNDDQKISKISNDNENNENSKNFNVTTSTRKNFRFRTTTLRPNEVKINTTSDDFNIFKNSNEGTNLKNLNDSRKLYRFRSTTQRSNKVNINNGDENNHDKINIKISTEKFSPKFNRHRSSTIKSVSDNLEILTEESSTEDITTQPLLLNKERKKENKYQDAILEDFTPLLEEIFTTTQAFETSLSDSHSTSNIISSNENENKNKSVDTISKENFEKRNLSAKNNNTNNEFNREIINNDNEEFKVPVEILNSSTISPEPKTTSQRGTIRFRQNKVNLSESNSTKNDRKIIRKIKIQYKNSDKLNTVGNELGNSLRPNSQLRNTTSRRVNIKRRPFVQNDQNRHNNTLKNEEREEISTEPNPELFTTVVNSSLNRTRIIKRRRRPTSTSPQPIRETLDSRGWSATGPTPSPLPDEDVKINSIRDQRESLGSPYAAIENELQLEDINEDEASDYADSLYTEVEPSKATTTRRPVSPAFTKRLRKRPIATSNQSTTTVASTTLETEEPTTKKPTVGRIIRRRKFQRSNSTEEAGLVRGRGRNGFQKTTPQNTKAAELSTTQPTITTKKFAFPRRRTTTTTTTSTTSTTTSAPYTPEDILIEEDDSHKDSLEAPAHIDTQTIDASTVKNLPDLARTAVAALTNLVTASPLPVVSSSGSPTLRASTPSAFSVFSSTPRFTTGPVLFSSTALPTTSVAPVARGRQRAKPFAKVVTSPSPPSQVVVTRIRAPIPPPIPDYEYYDDLSGFLEQSIPNNKVKIHSDGYIECLDQGNFPHPFSCKKFISCAKMENGEVLGWEYTCPKHLSFDPIGGICNWSAGLGCKE